MKQTTKGLQSYFGLSDERGEAFISAVVKAWSANLLDKEMPDVNAVKHKTFMDVFVDLSATPRECCLIGILIEQSCGATLAKPKVGFLGKLK